LSSARCEILQCMQGIQAQRQASGAAQIAAGEADVVQHMVIEFGKLGNFLAGKPIAQKVGGDIPDAWLKLAGSDVLCVLSHCSLL